MSCRIHIAYWIVITVSKHVIAENALASGSKSVGVDESAYLRIVITALEVIELGFLVAHIAMLA